MNKKRNIKAVLEDAKAVENIARMVFKTTDSNHDKFISKSELETLIRYIAKEADVEAPAQSDIDDILKTFDSNIDGQLSFEEFVPFSRDVLKALSKRGY